MYRLRSLEASRDAPPPCTVSAMLRWFASASESPRTPPRGGDADLRRCEIRGCSRGGERFRADAPGFRVSVFQGWGLGVQGAGVGKMGSTQARHTKCLGSMNLGSGVWGPGFVFLTHNPPLELAMPGRAVHRLVRERKRAHLTRYGR
jgi:hypothetical protein